MPNYTIELHRLVEKVPLKDGETNWSEVAKRLGLDEYPIFDEAYRDRLNRDIVENFYFREIGHETPERFQFAMRRKMRLEMEVFNDMFESQRIKFDPMATIDMRTMTKNKDRVTAEASSSTAQTSEQNSSSRSVDQSTPQVALKGNADYASGATDVNGKTGGKANGEETSSSASENDAEGESRTTGYQGSSAALITAYRASLVNVTMMLLERLEELFMGVWGTDNDFYQKEWPINVGY